MQTAKVLGNTLGVVSVLPSAYNTITNKINGQDNTSDWVDLGISSSLLVTGLLVANPVGLGVLAVVGLGYGILRLSAGDSIDAWINDKVGFR